MKGYDQKGVNQEQEIYDIYNFVDRNLKHIVNPEKAVTLYFRNRVMLYLVSIATLAYSLAFVHFLNDHTHYAAQALGTTHTTYCESAYSLVNFLTCVFGLYTIHSHRVELFTRHQRLIILSVIIDFVLTNTFPQLAILLGLKCFAFVLSRRVLRELYTVLIIPKDTPDGGESQVMELAAHFD